MYLGIYIKANFKQKTFFYTNNSGVNFTNLSLEMLLAYNQTFCSVEATQLLSLEGIPFKNNNEVLKNRTKKEIERLILEDYQKEGKEFFENWNGHWSLSLWDNKKQELLITRNKLGNKTIYYYDCPRFFVYTTSLSTILKLPFVPKELNVSAILQLGPNLKQDGQTFYKGINQLPKAHYLILKNNQLSIHNYWMPIIQPSIQYKRFEDYVEHFNEIYKQVIIENLTGFKKPSIALSSGLDSGSMFAVAAPYLTEHNRQLEAVTWQSDVIDNQYNLPKRVLNETYLVKKLVQGFNNTQLNIVTSEQGNIIPFYQKLLENCHQPIMNLQPHIMEIFARSKKVGVDVMLNGFEGNFTVSYTGKHSLKIANISNLITAFSFFSKKIIARLNNPFGKKGYKNISNDYIQKIAIQENKHLYTALTPELERRRKNTKGRYSHIINTLQATSLEDFSVYTQHLGFESRTPVVDSRIIDFCFGIPNNVFSQNGESKRLLKAAMSNKMPKEVLHNPNRGLQGTNYVSKIKSEFKAFNELLAEFEQSKLISYWLDIDLMRLHLQGFNNPATSRKAFFETANLNIITRGLQLGLFLQRFENGKY